VVWPDDFAASLPSPWVVDWLPVVSLPDLVADGSEVPVCGVALPFSLELPCEPSGEF
jgi:hypothetical protein